MTQLPDEILLNKQNAAALIGVSTPTLNKLILSAMLKGLPNPFQPRNGLSGRGYTNARVFREWLIKARNVDALPPKLQNRAA